MASKKRTNMFDIGDLQLRKSADTEPAPSPIDITNNITQRDDYMEIPCDSLCNYRNKDPHDIIDKSDPEYKALVVSIAEKGVYDAIIVRPITDDTNLQDRGILFEILEGHHRVEASRDAGKATIPARIIQDCDDSIAQDIYYVTNLLKKKLSIRDLAYGWWHYFHVTRYKSEEEVNKLIADGAIAKEYDIVRRSKENKQLRRYARLHELTDEMLELVDKKIVSIKFGEQISYISKDLQNDLLEYKSHLSPLKKAVKLRKLADGEIEGEEWSKEAIERILLPATSFPETAQSHMDDKTFITALHEIIPKEYHGEEKMLNLIQSALELYFNQENQKNVS